MSRREAGESQGSAGERDRGSGAPDGLGRGYTLRVRQRELKRPGRNIAIALLLAGATFYLYAFFLANTSFSDDADTADDRQDGVLVVESCERNWLLFGARSICSGTITPNDSHSQFGETVNYVNSYSEMQSSDAGKAMPVQEVGGVFGFSWQVMPAREAGFVPLLLVGPLGIVAFSQCVFAAGLAVRWCFGTARSSLGERTGKA